MIISKTPYRISFFGGGTDYPVWYRRNEGSVLASTIDKYCYIFCRILPPYFNHKHHVVWSRIEQVQKTSDIAHPAVKAIMQTMKISHGIEIHHIGDLPARSGLGSSSSFTVGLLHAMHALRGVMPTKLQLATQAIHIERDVLKENVGSQDQVLASFGGFNKISFTGHDQIKIEPILLSLKRIEDLHKHFLLYYTGISRTASKIAKKQISNTPKKQKELSTMSQMVDEAISILSSKRNILEFGALLHESWQLKRSLSDAISNKTIDDIYKNARASGAIGGKLLGAGGGGFMLLFVKPENQSRVKKRLTKLTRVPFQFEEHGSRIIFNYV